MTLAELMEQVRAEAGVDAGDEVRLPTDTLRQFVLEAVAHVSEVVRGPWTYERLTLSVTAHQDSVVLPARVIAVHTLYYTSESGETVVLVGGSRRQKGFWEINELRAAFSDSGEGDPQAAALWGDEIILAPTPSRHITLAADVRAVPEEPQSDAGELGVPAYAIPAVRMEALALAFGYLLEDERLRLYRGRADAEIASLAVRSARAGSIGRGRRRSWGVR